METGCRRRAVARLARLLNGCTDHPPPLWSVVAAVPSLGIACVLLASLGWPGLGASIAIQLVAILYAIRAAGWPEPTNSAFPAPPHPRPSALAPTNTSPEKRPAMTSDDDRRIVTQVMQRLSQRYPTISDEQIRRSVERAYSDLQSSTIRDFLPVLVERAASEQLDARQR